jgi:hypothetical protein
LPDVAPEGTFAIIALSLHLAIDAGVPLNVTVLEPCCPPKFEPIICTEAPKRPDGVDKLLMAGGPAGGGTLELELAEPPPPHPAQINSRMTATANTLSDAWGNRSDMFSYSRAEVFLDSPNLTRCMR